MIPFILLLIIHFSDVRVCIFKSIHRNLNQLHMMCVYLLQREMILLAATSSSIGRSAGRLVNPLAGRSTETPCSLVATGFALRVGNLAWRSRVRVSVCDTAKLKYITTDMRSEC